MVQTASQNHSTLPAPLFFLPSLLFECVVRARNGLYDTSFFAQARLPHPVVSVGNLTVGGSGKTPLVVLVAQTVARLGAIPVLLSRGYGRSEKGAVVLPPGTEVPTPARLVGDEPALMRRHEPRLWLGISHDRRSVARQIAGRAERLVYILDDGFQHRRLKRDLDIVVIDRTQPLAGNRLLPGGTLREPPSGLRRAGIIVINGSLDSRPDDPLEKLVRSLNRQAAVFHCQQRIERLAPFRDWQESGPAANPCRAPGAVYLVAAIGNPGRFRSDIQSLGIDVRGDRFFRDHARLSRTDWRECARKAASVGAAALITTEKDAIKITDPLDFPLLVAVQSTRLAEQAVFEQQLKELVGGGR